MKWQIEQKKTAKGANEHQKTDQISTKKDYKHLFHCTKRTYTICVQEHTLSSLPIELTSRQ